MVDPLLRAPVTTGRTRTTLTRFAPSHTPRVARAGRKLVPAPRTGPAHPCRPPRRWRGSPGGTRDGRGASRGGCCKTMVPAANKEPFGRGMSWRPCGSLFPPTLTRGDPSTRGGAEPPWVRGDPSWRTGSGRDGRLGVLHGGCRAGRGRGASGPGGGVLLDRDRCEHRGQQGPWRAGGAVHGRLHSQWCPPLERRECPGLGLATDLGSHTRGNPGRVVRHQSEPGPDRPAEHPASGAP